MENRRRVLFLLGLRCVLIMCMPCDDDDVVVDTTHHDYSVLCFHVVRIFITWKEERETERTSKEK